MMKGITVENTLLPAVVHKWGTNANEIPENFALLMGAFKSMFWDVSDEYPVPFGRDHPDRQIMYRKISFDRRPDFMGFTEADFLKSFADLLAVPESVPTNGLNFLRYALIHLVPAPPGVDQMARSGLPGWESVLLCCAETSDRSKSEYSDIETMLRDLDVPIDLMDEEHFIRFGGSELSYEYHGARWSVMRSFLQSLRDDLSAATA
jgi:hypothetical protein